MKNSISKFSVLLIAIIMSQITYGQTVIGIEAGANLVDPKSTDFDQTIGYHVGLTFDFPFSNVFSFETGMFYSKKNIEDAYGDELRLGYIDIPLTLKASFQIGSGNTKIYVAGGGFVNWGISGKGKIDGYEIDIWQDDSQYLRRYDFGATFGAGIEFGAIQVGGAYDMGLYNISQGESDLYLNVIKISLAYRFID